MFSKQIKNKILLRDMGLFEKGFSLISLVMEVTNSRKYHIMQRNLCLWHGSFPDDTSYLKISRSYSGPSSKRWENSLVMK